MIRENVDDTRLENSAVEEASQHAISIGWVDKNPVVHSWDSSSSDGAYMVMAIKHKRIESRWGTVADKIKWKIHSCVD